MKTLSPIVLFTYNRLSHTRQTIEALQKNNLAKKSELYIYSDGGKDSNSWKKVNEIRKYLKTIDGFKRITIIEQKENLGLAKSIISGVTKIVNQYGKIIVLEDDIITSTYFLTYMNNALNFYENTKEVWHISGYTHPINYNIKNMPDSYFIKPTTCWGWGTWLNRWEHFNNDIDEIINLFNQKMIFDFNLNNSYDYWSHILLNKNKTINTWAIFWYATVYLNKGLSLHPKQSYTIHIGDDEEGTHCKIEQPYYNKNLNESKIDLSNQVFENVEVKEEILKYYKRVKHNTNNFHFSKLFNNLLPQIETLAKKDSKYLIYGAGNIGKMIYPYLKENIIGFIDRDSVNKKLFKNVSIYSLDYIDTLNYSKIIISVLGRENEIRNDLINNYNVHQNDIIEFYI